MIGAERFGEFDNIDGDRSIAVEGSLNSMSDDEINEALRAYESEAIVEGSDPESEEVLLAIKKRILEIAEELMRGDQTLIEQDAAIDTFRGLMDDQLKDCKVSPESFRIEAVNTLREVAEMKN